MPNIFTMLLPTRLGGGSMAFTVSLLLVMTTLYASGGFLLKRFADGHGWQWFAFSACVYVFGNLTYSRLLAVTDLAVGTVLSSCAQILIVCLVGHFILSEHLSWTQWIGVLAAVVGVVLVSVPQGS